MGREDYLQYYIQGSDHYLIPKDIFDELFNEMENWKKEAHQYKEVIDKAIKYIEQHAITVTDGTVTTNKHELLEILKEVE